MAKAPIKNRLYDTLVSFIEVVESVEKRTILDDEVLGDIIGKCDVILSNLTTEKDSSTMVTIANINLHITYLRPYGPISTPEYVICSNTINAVMRIIA